MRSLLPLLFLFAITGSWSQQRITVVDDKDGRTLPLARITPRNGTPYLADINGQFTLHTENYSDTIEIGYNGYQTETIWGGLLLDIDTVRLTEFGGDLAAVPVTAGENPARKIIMDVIRAKQKHDPAGKKPWKASYYNMVRFDVTLPDTLDQEDTSMMRLKEFLDDSYLFLMESVSERYYSPGNLIKERILDQRISGIEEPTLAVIASQMQSFSFYDDYFSLVGIRFSNPLHKATVDQYAFQIEDTLVDGADTVVAIRFQPKPNVLERAVKGVMYIHMEDHALSSVTAEPLGTGMLKGSVFSHKYRRVKKQWFPENIRADLNFGGFTANGRNTHGLALSRLDSLEFDPDKEVFKGMGYAVEVSQKRPDSAHTIEHLRADTADVRMLKTYLKLDSLADEANVDKLLFFTSRLLEGYIPFWKLELDIASLLGGNNFEGYRLGLGLQTNPKLSKYLSVGGYGAYGTQDRKWKYGGHVKIYPKAGPEYQIKLGYRHDIRSRRSESPFFSMGGLDWNRMFSSFYQDTMDYVTSAYVQGKVMLKANLSLLAEGSYNLMRPGSDLVLNTPDSTYSLMGNYWQAGIKLRWGIREKVTKLFNQISSTPSDWPILFFGFDMGIPSQGSIGPFAFSHASLGILQQNELGKAGKFKSWASVHSIWGSPGMPFLNFGRGTRSNFGVEAPMTFQTMRPNEFGGDFLAQLFVEWELPSIQTGVKWLSWFRPTFVLSGGAGYSELANSTDHAPHRLEDMSKGYYEAGVAVRNILVMRTLGLGLGAYYRIGPYAFQNEKDNFTFRITFTPQF